MIEIGNITIMILLLIEEGDLRAIIIILTEEGDLLAIMMIPAATDQIMINRIKLCGEVGDLEEDDHDKQTQHLSRSNLRTMLLIQAAMIEKSISCTVHQVWRVEVPTAVKMESSMVPLITLAMLCQLKQNIEHNHQR